MGFDCAAIRAALHNNDICSAGLGVLFSRGLPVLQAGKAEKGKVTDAEQKAFSPGKSWPLGFGQIELQAVALQKIVSAL